MSRPPDDAEALIAALAQQSRSGSPAAELDPEPEELLEYLAGRLPPEEEERIGRRLVASPEAARALLDLADFEAAGAAAEGAPSELAVLAGWQDLKKRLPPAETRPRRFPPLLSSVAAALLVSTLSLGVLAVRQREELRRPVANVPTRELDAGSRAAGEQILELPAGRLLRLVVAQSEHCLKYEAMIQGPERRDLVKGLEVDALGNLTVVVPVELGSYSLRLQGCGRELGVYRFRITADGR
jgi:hypothetical protein